MDQKQEYPLIIFVFCKLKLLKQQFLLFLHVMERKGFDTFVEVAREMPRVKFMWFGDVRLSNPTSKIKKLLKELPEIWNCCVNSLICLDVGLNCATSTPYTKSLLESYDLNKEIYPISNGVDVAQFNPTS